MPDVVSGQINVLPATVGIGRSSAPKNEEVAISEAKRAIELLPISKDAVYGRSIEINLAVVYAWTNELGLAFEKLSSLIKVPNGIFYGELKRDPYWSRSARIRGMRAVS